MKSYCSGCNTPVMDIADNLIMGCIKCGNKKVYNKKIDDYPIDLNESDKNIAITVLKKGEYILNLENIINREKNDPLMVKDVDGKVNVLFNPDQ